MSAVLSDDETLDALNGIVPMIEAATRPNTTICAEDGCLIITGERCPACELRKPRNCECGRRLKHPDADLCWVCLRLARAAAQRFCDCGTAIRTDADQCSRCQRKPAGSNPGDVDRPFHWVRRGGILRPVFEDVA